MNFHCTKINWKKSVPHFGETLCTRLSGRLRVLALISGRPPSFPPSTQPCRAPGPASVSDVVKQGLTRWWRGLPKQWPTGAASRGCRGRRRGETKGETKRRNQGLRSHLGKREEDSNAHRLCNYLQATTRRLYFFRIRFQMVPFPRLQRNALFCVCTWVYRCFFLHECACLLDICDHFILQYVLTRPSAPLKGPCVSYSSLLRTNLVGLLGLIRSNSAGATPQKWRRF